MKLYLFFSILLFSQSAFILNETLSEEATIKKSTELDGLDLTLSFETNKVFSGNSSIISTQVDEESEGIVEVENDEDTLKTNLEEKDLSFSMPEQPYLLSNESVLFQKSNETLLDVHLNEEKEALKSETKTVDSVENDKVIPEIYMNVKAQDKQIFEQKEQSKFEIYSEESEEKLLNLEPNISNEFIALRETDDELKDKIKLQEKSDTDFNNEITGDNQQTKENIDVYQNNLMPDIKTAKENLMTESTENEINDFDELKQESYSSSESTNSHGQVISFKDIEIFLNDFYIGSLQMAHLAYLLISEYINPIYLPIIFIYITISFFYFLYFKIQNSLIKHEQKKLTTKKSRPTSINSKRIKKLNK